MSNVWEYQKSGVNLASDYPYFSGSTGNTGTCGDSSHPKVAKVTGMANLMGGNDILWYLQTWGPVAVTVNAGQTAFMNYSSGILNSQNCGFDYLDHAITAVAYVPPQTTEGEPATT